MQRRSKSIKVEAAQIPAKKAPLTVIVNKAGGPAFKQTANLEVLSTLLTSFAEDTFSPDSAALRLRTVISKMKPEQLRFTAKACIYARNVYGMRSITHAVAAMIGKYAKGKQWARRFFKQVVRRPDDICEILKASFKENGKTIPNSMKRGLAEAFGKFDAYQLSKYKGENDDVKLIDAVNLVHPKPTDANKEALGALVKGELKSTETWEAMLSAAGKDTEKKKEAWISLLNSNKLGYMALLRNLRNIAAQAPEALTEACRQLVNEDQIQKSLVMPFRFYKAHEELKNDSNITKKVLTSVAAALDISLNNVPKFEGKTAVILDASGSMRIVYDKAAIFAAALVKANNADLILFDTTARYASLEDCKTTLAMVNRLQELMTGGGTYMDGAFKLMANKSKVYDRLVVISDMQNWASGQSADKEYELYKKKTGASPKLYSFDVSASGTMQFPQKDVVAISGWSEKVFDMMKLVESDPNKIYEEIDRIPLPEV